MDSSKAVFTIGAISASTQFTVTFAINNFNLAAARDFTVTTSEYVAGAPPVETIQDTGTATLAAATPSYAIGYNSNGGTGGSMSATTSSGSLTLPANGFVKTGSTFAGWRVGNASSGTIYQPGDTVTITQAVLVYAQWTDASGSSSTSSDSLANTGINTATGISLLAGGLSLALVGAEMFMIARRKRSN